MAAIPSRQRRMGRRWRSRRYVERTGWHYPRHLAGRVFAVVVHGDTVGAETLRRSLTDWLTDMKLLPALPQGGIDRYIGYYEPYATSHHALDKDIAIQQEVRQTAKRVVEAVALARAGRFPQVAEPEPRPK